MHEQTHAIKYSNMKDALLRERMKYKLHVLKPSITRAALQL